MTTHTTRYRAPLGLGASLVLALLVSGCSMSGIKPAPGGASAALAAFAAPSTPAGHVPKASAVPMAASALGYTEGSMDSLIRHYSHEYAVRYLAGAYVTAGGNYDRSVRFYASGYYYDAKRAGLLQKAGLR